MSDPAALGGGPVPEPRAEVLAGLGAVPPGTPLGAVPPGEPAEATPVYDLDWRSVATAMVALAAMYGVFALVRATPRSTTWILIGTLLALALHPLVSGAERRLHCRKGAAVGVVLAGFGVFVAVLALVLGPSAVRQARDLGSELPEVVSQLGDIPLVGRQLEEADAPARVEEWIRDLPTRLSGDTTPLEDVGRSVLGGVLAGFATIVVTVVLLLDGERLVRRARRAVPLRHRGRADRLGDLLYRIVGKYFAGSLLVALIAGMAVLVVGLLLGVPLTPLAAVWVSCTNLIPQIGGAAGGIPFVLLGFAASPGTGVACAMFFVLYLQFENNVLQPLVVGQAVDLSPPATMVAALVGVSAAGVPGALVAVPLLGVAKAMYLELRPPATPLIVAGRRDHEPRPRAGEKPRWRRRGRR